MVANNDTDGTGAVGGGTGDESDDNRNARTMVAVGRMVKPMRIVLTSTGAAVCPVSKELLLEGDVTYSLFCGAPLLVDPDVGDEFALKASTIPYHSISLTFFVPRDRVRVHEFITFDVERGAFAVWNEARTAMMGIRMSLALAEALLEERMNKEADGAGAEDNG
jgi:hypothetical protein